LIIRSIPETVNIAVWLLWWASWLLAALWRDRAAKQPARGSQIWYRVLAIAGALLLFQPIVPLIDVPLWHSAALIQWTLVAVTVAGFAFTWWARIHLGRLWSSNVGRKADHHIVDTGPYGLVRHPIYTGITLASISTAALRATVGGWIGVALMTLGWYVKARLEERFLRAELGADNYDAYVRRVPMLVPFTR
jgi:protein-S-isoprenylcysteine O-methyltransferase Ste14